MKGRRLSVDLRALSITTSVALVLTCAPTPAHAEAPDSVLLRQWAPVIASSRTEGNVVLTRLPVVSSTYHQMHATGDWSAMYSNRSAAQATGQVGGAAVQIFSTHLDAYNSSYPSAQLIDLMAWAQTFGSRRIIGLAPQRARNSYHVKPTKAQSHTAPLPYFRPLFADYGGIESCLCRARSARLR